MESTQNDNFVEQFAELNNYIKTSEIDGWFQADGPSYELMEEQQINDLVSAAEEHVRDEKEDPNENKEQSIQIMQCPVSHSEAVRMLDQCLTWLHLKPEALVGNT